MTNEKSSSALDAVTVLMDERRRYESWLAALDARRSSTPAHVFTRVHADYTGRLEAVIAQLTTHAESLQREVERLVSELAALNEQRQHLEDERAEAELRAHVGELSADAWDTTANAIDTRLADLAEQQRTHEQDLELTREMLAGTSPATVQTVPVSDEAEAEMHVPAASSAPNPEPASPTHEAAQEPPAPAPAVPESAPRSAATVNAPSVIQPASQPPREPAQAAFDELAFLSSVVDTPSGAMDAAPKNFPDERARRDSFALREQQHEPADVLANEMTPPRPLASIEYEQEGEPLLSRVAPADGARTLKCYKCGMMNYPTEWYCVSCGAELASL